VVNRQSWWLLVVVTVSFAGCNFDAMYDARCDSGACVDGGSTELDGGGDATDGGPGDAGTTDAGTTNAGTTDAGATDAGATDAGATDAGITDAGATDAGATDAGACAYTLSVSFPDAGDARADAWACTPMHVALLCNGNPTQLTMAQTFDISLQNPPTDPSAVAYGRIFTGPCGTSTPVGSGLLRDASFDVFVDGLSPDGQTAAAGDYTFRVAAGTGPLSGLPAQTSSLTLTAHAVFDPSITGFMAGLSCSVLPPVFLKGSNDKDVRASTAVTFSATTPSGSAINCTANTSAPPGITIAAWASDTTQNNHAAGVSATRAASSATVTFATSTNWIQGPLSYTFATAP
jgi:hypothetical protein